MCYEITRSPILGIDAAAGGTSVLDPATPGTIVPDYGIVAAGTSYNIPGGAYKAKVWNTGLEDITVAGELVPPGQTFTLEHEINKTTNVQDFTSSILVVVPAGGEATYIAYRPSA